MWIYILDPFKSEELRLSHPEGLLGFLWVVHVHMYSPVWETCHSILTFLVFPIFNLSLLHTDYLKPSNSLVLCLVKSRFLLNL